MIILQFINLAVRFLLELCALAALGYWGFASDRGPVIRIVLGIGAPLLAAIVWGLFVAPAASIKLQAPLRLILELLVFGSAVAALYAAGRPTLAAALALIYAINKLLLTVWHQ